MTETVTETETETETNNGERCVWYPDTGYLRVPFPREDDVPCPACHGAGTQDWPMGPSCPACHGYGREEPLGPSCPVPRR